MTIDSQLAQNQSQVLYRHRKCPQWGLAVLAWENIDKRGYQFEDGNLRVFKSGFYTLLEDVEPPADQSRRVLEFLNRTLGRSQAVAKAASRDVVLIPFTDQVTYFKAQYPGGFLDKVWLEKIRGDGVARPLKRHRNPALARAKEQLSASALDRMIADQDHAGVINALTEVLEQTNLVTATKLKPLSSALHYHQQTIALAVRELLHGEEDFSPRFSSWVNSMGKPSWELATAPLALINPGEHICVKPSVFEQQALWLSPRLRHVRLPRGETYQHYLKMAVAIFEQLESAELKPQDLMDVYDFIDVTLRPATRKLLAKNSCERSAQEAAPREPEAAEDKTEEETT